MKLSLLPLQVRVVLISAAMLLGGAFLALYVSNIWHTMNLRKQADSLIAKVEAYRTTARHPPATLEELGMKSTLEGPLYYQREGESHYIIWFGESLGESRTYRSVTKSWAN